MHTGVGGDIANVVALVSGAAFTAVSKAGDRSGDAGWTIIVGYGKDVGALAVVAGLANVGKGGGIGNSPSVRSIPVNSVSAQKICFD